MNLQEQKNSYKPLQVQKYLILWTCKGNIKRKINWKPSHGARRGGEEMKELPLAGGERRVRLITRVSSKEVNCKMKSDTQKGQAGVPVVECF